MRNERRRAEVGVELGLVAMPLDLVRRQVLRDRDEVRRLGRLAAGAGHAGLRVDERVRGEVLQRQQRQQRGGRVAARRGHELRVADLVAVQLGQPVHGLVEQLRRRMRPVPALVQLARDAEVRGQVDHLQPARAQVLDGRRGRAVRVGDERRVAALGDAVGVEGLELAIDAVARVEVGQQRGPRRCAP